MIYWDTSALIFFILEKKTDEISGVTRTHSLAEAFSSLTGSGWQERLPGGIERQRRMGLELAAQTIRQIKSRLEFIELNPDEVVSALDAAKGMGAQGGAIYDFLHARAAEKAKATEFWTTDRNDFKRLLTTIPIKQLGED